MAKRIVVFEKAEEKLPPCYAGLAKEIKGYRTPKPTPEKEAKNRLELLFAPRLNHATVSY